MRGLHDVKIIEGVSHVVAPRDPEQRLRLSDVLLPLGDGVDEILAAHVEGGLSDAQAKAASFVDRRDNRPGGGFLALVNEPDLLLDISRSLASALFAIADEDQRVSDGTLAVLRCRALDGGDQAAQFHAVLKLDPSATLRTITDIDPDSGGVRVRYEVDRTSLPSKHERIQKCVFVGAMDPDAEFEMLVVDRQRRGEVVSQFWVDDFLGAELVLDGGERTRRLYRSLLQARNDVQQDLDADQLAALSQVIDGAVVQARVNLDTLIAGLPVPEPVRDRIDAIVSDALPDREFDLDQEVARPFVRRRTYRGDHGIRLTVDADHVDMIKVEDQERGDDDTRLRQVSFETRTWTES